jgi:hypothetical protein
MTFLYLGGVICYDAYTKCDFTLRAHIIAWTGDIPALTKIMNITGHNSYSGCRFCDIRGVYSKKHNHVYFRPGEYAKKNHSDWFLRINEIEDAETSREKETLIQRYGKSYFMLFMLL